MCQEGKGMTTMHPYKMLGLPLDMYGVKAKAMEDEVPPA